MLVSKITSVVALVVLWTSQTAYATTVGGIISTNTVWSNLAEPYTFSSPIQVKNGVTLTIMPGVKIENGDIRVYGNLVSAGISSNNIMFSNVNIIPSGNGDPSKQFSINISETKIQGGSLYYPTGNVGYGSLSLQDSYLKNIPYMYIWYPTSDVTIQRNYFEDFGGISVGSNNVDILIENNYFDSPANFAIQNWASYGSAITTVRYNSFVTGGDNIISLPAGYNSAKMDASENYWGTIDTTAIQAMIFDQNDDLSSAGNIQYLPFLLDHHPNTPQTPFASTVPLPASFWLFGAGFLFVYSRLTAQSSRLVSAAENLGNRTLAK